MNVVYLPQLTNLDITNRNPLEYMKDYDNPEFEKIMSSHLLPAEILAWSRSGTLPDNAIDQFIEGRVANILADLKTKLNSVTFDEIDTKAVQKSQDLQ